MISSSSQVSISLCNTQRHFFAPFSVIFPVTRRMVAEIWALISKKKKKVTYIINFQWMLKSSAKSSRWIGIRLNLVDGVGGCSDAL